MTSPSQQSLPALNSFRRQSRWRCFRRPRLDVDPVGCSLGARCWLARLCDRVGRMKAFSALLVFAIYPMLATSQELSVHDQIALHAQKAQQFLRANQPDRAIPEFRSILAIEPGN